MISHGLKIIEKPDWVSWDDIHQCLWKSHEINRLNGMTMRTTLLTGEELKQRVESKSIKYKTFVALDDNRLVGTGTVSIQKKQLWCVNGKVAYIMLVGVISDYSGQGIYKQLYNELERERALIMAVNLFIWIPQRVIKGCSNFILSRGLNMSVFLLRQVNTIRL